jgi:four helix bundle protein
LALAERGIAHASNHRMSEADHLQDRIELFVDAVVEFCEPIPITAKTERFLKQLTGAATSVGANYRASRRARSHAEFAAKIGVVAEEADESEFWLARAVRYGYGESATARRLRNEALELTKIFARSAKTARSRDHPSPNRQARDRQSPKLQSPTRDTPNH